MPTEAEKRRWIQRNEFARREDRERDHGRSMAELVEETARLSVAVSELRANVERSRDVRSV